MLLECALLLHLDNVVLAIDGHLFHIDREGTYACGLQG